MVPDALCKGGKPCITSNSDLPLIMKGGDASTRILNNSRNQWICAQTDNSVVLRLCEIHVSDQMIHSTLVFALHAVLLEKHKNTG